MKYICKVCNYETNDSGHWVRHKKTIKHIEKWNEVTNNYPGTIQKLPKNYPKTTQNTTRPEKRENIQQLTNTIFSDETLSTSEKNEISAVVAYECEFCGKNFKFDSGYYRHKKFRCKGRNEINTCEVKLLKEQVETLKKDNQMLEKEKDIHRTKEEIYKNENEYHKNLTTNAGQIVGKSLSTLAFIVQNFKNAPPIKAIGNEDFKRLVFEDNMGRKIHKNKKISNYDTSKLLNGYHRHNKLFELFNNIIVKHYKKDEPKDQSMWSSDTSRFTYVISDVISNDGKDESAWVTDKRGVKVNELVVKPLMEYVDNLMIEYIGDIHASIRKGDFDANACLEELRSSTEIREKVRNHIIHQRLVKAIVPHFYLDRELQKIENWK